IIAQPLCETHRFAPARKHPRIVTLARYCEVELEVNIEPALQCGSVLREMLEGFQRVFEPGGGLLERGTIQRLRAGLPEIAHGGLPDFAIEGMMGEPLDVLSQAAGMEPLDGLDNPGVQRAATVLEHAAVGYLVREGVLEGVLGVRGQAR